MSHIRGTTEIYREKNNKNSSTLKELVPWNNPSSASSEKMEISAISMLKQKKILNRNLSIHVRAAEQLSVRVRNEFIPFLSIVFLVSFLLGDTRRGESESSLPKKQDETVKRLSRQPAECVPSLSSWNSFGALRRRSGTKPQQRTDG
jgi:hypothetical protein